MSATLPYGRQWIDEDDVEAVVRVLRSDFLTTGPEVDAFEAELAAACGARFAVVVANGTAALHCAYAAAGIGADDEVITSPLTFSATANMVIALGGRPVFADVDPKTLCLDPEKARAAIGPRTRALAPVDFAGCPAALDELIQIARQKNLMVVEDASHSIGGRYRGRPIGTVADLTTFSFHPVKTITTGEGGAILTNDATLARRARDFRNHGLVRDESRLERNDGAWYYEVQSLGFNYRLSALQCALGRSQLRELPDFVARRTEIVNRYQAAFVDLALQRPTDPADCEPAWHLYAVRVPGGPAARKALFASLTRRGIGCQVHYVAVNDLPLYRRLGYRREDTPLAWEASQSILSLPLYPAMSDADVERVIAAVRTSVAELP